MGAKCLYFKKKGTQTYESIQYYIMFVIICFDVFDIHISPYHCISRCYGIVFHDAFFAFGLSAA